MKEVINIKQSSLNISKSHTSQSVRGNCYNMSLFQTEPGIKMRSLTTKADENFLNVPMCSSSSQHGSRCGVSPGYLVTSEFIFRGSSTSTISTLKIWLNLLNYFLKIGKIHGLVWWVPSSQHYSLSAKFSTSSDANNIEKNTLWTRADIWQISLYRSVRLSIQLRNIWKAGLKSEEWRVKREERRESWSWSQG